MSRHHYCILNYTIDLMYLTFIVNGFCYIQRDDNVTDVFLTMIIRLFTNILFIIYKPKSVWGKRHWNSIKYQRLWSDIKKSVDASCSSVRRSVAWLTLKKLWHGKNPYTIHRETYLRTKCKEKNRFYTCSKLLYFQLNLCKI